MLRKIVLMGESLHDGPGTYSANAALCAAWQRRLFSQVQRQACFFPVAYIFYCNITVSVCRHAGRAVHMRLGCVQTNTRTNTATALSSHTDTHSPGVGRSHGGSFSIPGSELKTHMGRGQQLSQLLMCMRAVIIRNNAFGILHDRSNYRNRRPLLLEMAQ